MIAVLAHFDFVGIGFRQILDFKIAGRIRIGGTEIAVAVIGNNQRFYNGLIFSITYVAVNKAVFRLKVNHQFIAAGR